MIHDDPKSSLRLIQAALGVLALMLHVAAAAEPLVSAPIPIDRSRDEFTLIVVPDTQRYAAYFPHIAHSQFAWIRDAADSLNVKFVMHVGDVVETGAEQEWQVMDECFGLLDGVVPYLVVPGNHDLDRVAFKEHRLRAYTKYNAVFSPKRFASQQWYGGQKGVSAENSFGYFTAGGQEFMVLGLEYGPSDATLAWARELVSNHNDRHKVIVVTHAFMYDDDTRLGSGDRWSPRSSGPDWNDGDDIWAKLVQPSTNIVGVFSGHVKGDGTGRLIESNHDGQPVVQILANYQFLTHGGEGWLRILRFRPRESKLDVFTYSPWLRRMRQEPDQQFTVGVPGWFPAATTVSKRADP